MRNIVIVGGGLAGLISSIQLIRAGISCTVLEKKSYPFHRVCGEYISNEALPFLTASGLYPKGLELPQINFFEFSSIQGRAVKLKLDLGGFGVSRYTFDNYLFRIAQREGVSFMLNNEVTAISFKDEKFQVTTQLGHLSADVVIGSFGKRSRIDIQQNRSFIKKRSPYVGVKYHLRANHPHDLISIHNFQGGYCGVCNVDGGLTNLCYLTHRENLKQTGDIGEMEMRVLYQNPLIRNIFSSSDFVFKKPEVINEISFETKEPVENHILMVGDAAGMITPVCGNGMAIAIHSGKIVSEFVREFCADRISRIELEEGYRAAWNKHFRARLRVGRKVQRLFGHRSFSTLAVNLARSSQSLTRLVMRQTHGRPF